MLTITFIYEIKINSILACRLAGQTDKLKIEPAQHSPTEVGAGAELGKNGFQFEKSINLLSSMRTHECLSQIGNQDINIDCQDKNKLIDF